MIKVKVKSVRESKSLKEWFSEKDFRAMSPEEQQEYLAQHPGSKFQPDNGGSKDNKTSNQDKVNTNQGSDTQQSKDKEDSDSDLLKQLTDIENQLRKARDDLSWQKKYDQIPANIKDGGRLSPATERLIYELENKKSALNKKIKASGKSREELSAKADPSTWFGLQDKTAHYKEDLPSMSKILKFNIPESSFNSLSDDTKDKYNQFKAKYDEIPSLEKLSYENDIAEAYGPLRKEWYKAYNKGDKEAQSKIKQEFSKLLKNKGYNIESDSVEDLFYESPDLLKAIKRHNKYYKDRYSSVKWNTLAELGALPYRNVVHTNPYDSYVSYTWDKDN